MQYTVVVVVLTRMRVVLSALVMLLPALDPAPAPVPRRAPLNALLTLPPMHLRALTLSAAKQSAKPTLPRASRRVPTPSAAPPNAPRMPPGALQREGHAFVLKPAKTILLLIRHI